MVRNPDKPAPPTLTGSLAALMYHAEKGVKADPFTEQNPERSIFLQRAGEALDHLDKLEMAVIKKTQLLKVEGPEQRAKNLDTLTQIIKKFVSKLTTTKPAMFPCEELASRIYDGDIR